MFKNPFSFNGRIRRTEFGISYVLFIFLFYMFVFMIEELNLVGFQVVLIFCTGYWFLLAQSAKRCHDLGNSGFYQLIPFYFFALIFSEGHNRTNMYGQDPKLLELYDREGKKPSTANKLIFPEEKTLIASGSEMLSGIMITALCIVLLNYFIIQTIGSIS